MDSLVFVKRTNPNALQKKVKSRPMREIQNPDLSFFGLVVNLIIRFQIAIVSLIQSPMSLYLAKWLLESSISSHTIMVSKRKYKRMRVSSPRRDLKPLSHPKTVCSEFMKVLIICLKCTYEAIEFVALTLTSYPY